MPEGHTIHRLAARHTERFGGRPVCASSPQGRFADAAALIDGRSLAAAEAHGKHLFLGFPGFRGPSGATGTEPPAALRWVHLHLGLAGKVTFGDGPAPEPVGVIRLRLVGADGYADLRAPAVCELITRGEKQAVHQRLGPDPLRERDDPAQAWPRINRSRLPIAALLLDQKIIAGVGNIYRAEALFRHGIDPYLPGREVTPDQWAALWDDLAALMREGVKTGRIDTVRPEHLPEAMGRPPRVDAHGGEVYVYRRARRRCHVCATEIRAAQLQGRNLFWCPTCQARP